MSVQEPFQELDELDLSDLEGDGESSDAPKGIINLLWHYHPLILLTLSLATAAATYMLWPEQLKSIDTLDGFYNQARTELQKAMNPGNPQKIRKHIQAAKVNFSDLFRYYKKEIDQRLDLQNPYLLRAESDRLYWHYLPKAKPDLKTTISYYNRALGWERDSFGSGEKAAEKRATFYLHNYPDIPKNLRPAELKFRRRIRHLRRERYIKYQQARMKAKIGQAQGARTILENLLRHLQREELAREQVLLQKSPTAAASSDLMREQELLPHPFELVAEDHARINFYLANIYEQLGETATAERAYRIFLQQAKRSRERFLAMMQLGKIEMARGQKAKGTGSSTRETARQASVHFSAAAETFCSIVQASAPEDIMREAYFKGAVAYLALAEGMLPGGENWWDRINNFEKDLRSQLETFSGRRLPDRALHLATGVGKLMLGEGTTILDPLALSSQGLLGGALLKASRNRKTLRTLRNERLARARQFLEGAQDTRTAKNDLYAGPSRVMIARTLLAEGRAEQARRLLDNAMRKYPSPAVHIASRMGIADSYLQNGDVLHAETLYLGGYMYSGDPSISPHDIEELQPLAQRLQQASLGKDQPTVRRVWDFLSPDERTAIQRIVRFPGRREKRLRVLVKSLNSVLRKRSFYSPKIFKGIKLPAATTALLQRDLSLLSETENLWLNRLLLEAIFYAEIRQTDPGLHTPPMPPWSELPKNILFTEQDLLAGLHRITHALLERADQLDTETQKNQRNRQDTKSLRDQQRRMLEDATRIGNFMLANYHPHPGETMMENAEYQERIADLIFPQEDLKEAKKWRGRAAQTYMRVFKLVLDKSTDADALRRRQALRRAGEDFFRAGYYGPASEATRAFAEQYGNSEQVGRIQNLRGRALEYQGRLEEAAKVYKINSDHRTPDGHKALYYMGDVYRRLYVLTDGKITRPRLGDPKKPYPQIDDDGLLQIDTALQAFNQVREIPGIGWESRPWRWATFALGETWYDIAQLGRVDDKVKPAGLDNFRRAELALREALERYLLKRTNGSSIDALRGKDPNLEPEDYGEIACARYRAKYLLAQVQTVLAENGQPKKSLEARQILNDLVNTSLYPDVMFSAAASKSLYLAIAQQAQQNNGEKPPPHYPHEPTLGISEGPRYTATELAAMRRNAFSMLGQNYFNEGLRLRTAKKPDRLHIRQAFREALRVFREAYDRLPPRDHPEAIYHQAECMLYLSRVADARKLFTLAINKTVPASKNAANLGVNLLGPEFWKEKARSRLRDIEEGFLPPPK